MERFESACRAVAARFDGALDNGTLDGHFTKLLQAGDRLAAVLMLLPEHCSYSLQMDFAGKVQAKIALADRAKFASVENNDEAAALLAALALAAQSGGRSTGAVH